MLNYPDNRGKLCALTTMGYNETIKKNFTQKPE